MSARAPHNLRSTQLLPVIVNENFMHHAEALGYRCNAWYPQKCSDSCSTMVACHRGILVTGDGMELTAQVAEPEKELHVM